MKSSSNHNQTSCDGLWKSVLITTTLLLLAVITPVRADLASNKLKNPKVAQLNSTPYGQTYDEWSAAWWQWALSIPTDVNPLFDETGANAAQGQSGPVWFLCGVFNDTGTAERTVTVPPGKALFFPVINFLWVSTLPTDPQTADEIRPIIKIAADVATDLMCEIDGFPVNNVGNYRTESPLFNVTVPANNLFGIDGCPCTFGPSLDEGFYLMLAPLSPGQHTLHFHGSQPADLPPHWSPFGVDITYHITVGH